MKKKDVILIVAIILLIIVLALILVKKNKENELKEVSEQEEQKYVKILENGTKINTSTEFNSTKTYNGLEISNIQFTEKDGMSVLLADIKNISNRKHEIEIVKITIIGENGEEIAEIKPIIGNIEEGETIKLNANITTDATNAKDFIIEAQN